MSTHCEQLASRLQKRTGEGLIDVKFYLKNVQEAASEQICKEINNLYAAIERGEYTRLDFKKRRA